MNQIAIAVSLSRPTPAPIRPRLSAEADTVSLKGAISIARRPPRIYRCTR